MTLSLLFGSYGLEPFLASPNGFAGWLFQSAWVPQHLMSASCAVAAMLFIVHFARRPSPARLVVLVLLVVAGFESSTYVGGVTFAAAAVVAAPIVLAGVAPGRRIGIAGGLAAAAALAVLIAAPFIRDQLATVAARGGGSPLVFHHAEVLGDMFAPTLRRALDVPAYWLILLPLEFPATFIAGLIALVVTVRELAAGPEKTAVAMFIALAGVGLVVPWLFVGTLGDNNDLGLRAILPAAMILIVAAAAAMMRPPRRVLIAATALAGLVLSLPDTAEMIYWNAAGDPVPDQRIFAQTPELWAAVRRFAAPAARVANNPSVPARPHAVAGEYVLGVACRSQLVLCRARNGARLRGAAGGPPRGDQCAIRPRLRRTRRRRRRRRTGEKIRLRRRRGGAAGRRLGQRPVRRKSRLSAGGIARGPLADLCAGRSRHTVIADARLSPVIH